MRDDAVTREEGSRRDDVPLSLLAAQAAPDRREAHEAFKVDGHQAVVDALSGRKNTDPKTLTPEHQAIARAMAAVLAHLADWMGLTPDEEDDDDGEVPPMFRPVTVVDTSAPKTAA